MPTETILDRWTRLRREMGLQQPLIHIRPEDNVLVGFPRISEYLGVKSWATLYQWVETYGFPAIKRPDGMWMTTMTAIDQWLFLAAEADNDTRQWSRGYSKRVDIALRRLQERVSEREQRIASGLPADGPDGCKGARAPGGQQEEEPQRPL